MTTPDKNIKNSTLRIPQADDVLIGMDGAETDVYLFGVQDLGRLPWSESDGSRTSGYYSATVFRTGSVSTGLNVTANHVRGQIALLTDIAWGSASIYVNQAGSGSDEVYIIAFNLDSSGLPSTAAATWGPFDVTSTGLVTLTGQTETLDQGWYFLGTWAGTLTGTPRVQTTDSGTGRLVHSGASLNQEINFSGQTTLPTTLASVTGNVGIGPYMPMLFGED